MPRAELNKYVRSPASIGPRSRTTLECGRRLVGTRHHRHFSTRLTDHTFHPFNSSMFRSRLTASVYVATQSPFLRPIATRLGATPQHSAQSENHRVINDGFFGVDVAVVFLWQAEDTNYYFSSGGNWGIRYFADSDSELTLPQSKTIMEPLWFLVCLLWCLR